MNLKSNLIVGANSFLGQLLSQTLYEASEKVLGVYHKNTQLLYKDTPHIPITQIDQLNDDFDVIYIVSGYVPNKNDEDVERKLHEANVLLVQKICDQFSNAKIVYCSSVSVYKATHTILSETSETIPSSAYGVSKLQGENIVKKHDAYAIVRISSMYGEHMKTTTFLPNAIKQALEHRTVVLYGKGERFQNYIHVADVAATLIAAANCKTNEVLHATATHSVSNLEIARKIQPFIPETTIVFKGEDTSNSFFYDNSYTRKTLQVPLNIPLEEGVKKLVSWMKKKY